MTLPLQKPARQREEAPARQREEALVSRREAAALLDAILRQGRTLDEALADAQPRLAALAARDRAFVRLITMTALRRLGQIDAVLGALIARPLPARASAVMDGLRVAAAQILFLATPAHAAADIAVTLTGQNSATSGFKPLVNAVARRLGREGAALAATLDAARLTLPDWLWQPWCAAYGEPLTRAIALCLLQTPPLDLSVRGDPMLWAQRLNGVALPTGSVRLMAATGAIAQLPGFDEGDWWVQDAAAALPARLLPVRPGMKILDLCAAPGGKTAQLAMGGADITALDCDAARMARLRETVARLRLAHVTCITADALHWRPPEPVDAVLLDAPCSATGTIRRHPDILHIPRRRTPTAMAAQQDQLLDAAVAMLKPGGVLVYCVCSLEPEEGLARITQLLARDPRMQRVPITANELAVPESPSARELAVTESPSAAELTVTETEPMAAELASLITPEKDLRTLPTHFSAYGGMDGFYAARLQRRF